MSLDLDAPVWTFGPAGPARFWLLLEADWPEGNRMRRPELPTRSLGIRATDSGRGWVVLPDGGSLHVTAVDGTAVGDSALNDVAVLVEATGNDLMIFL